MTGFDFLGLAKMSNIFMLDRQEQARIGPATQQIQSANMCIFASFDRYHTAYTLNKSLEDAYRREEDPGYGRRKFE